MAATNRVVDKTVKLRLVGLDGNAWVLMGAFQEQAKREGWTKAEIDKVMEAAMSGDYNNLIRVLDAHCEAPDEEDE